MKTPLDQLRDIARIQENEAGCNSYMLGMFNGLELALAILEQRDPQYRRKPDEGWLDDLFPRGSAPTEAVPTGVQANNAKAPQTASWREWGVFWWVV